MNLRSKSCLSLLVANLVVYAFRAEAQFTKTYRPGAEPIFVSSEMPPVFRNWHPTNQLKEPGIKSGPPFEAGLVKVFCEDTPWSSEMAVFRFRDGTVRQWKSKSFSPEDLAIMRTMKAKADALPAAPDNRLWVTRLDEANQKAVEEGSVTKFETRHFVFSYGKNPTEEVASTLNAPQFIEKAGQWFEKVWTAYESDLKAPMPHAGDPYPRRIVVKLYSTGVPGLGAGNNWANSAKEMGLNPRAMLYGSTVIGHEFGHVVQAYTGGFMIRPSVGPWWETHAEFGSMSVVPTQNDKLGVMLENLSHGCQWPDSRYSNWAILMHLWEKKRTQHLVFDVWTKNKRDPKNGGASFEDQIETTVRLGRADRSLPNGWDSWNDEVGEMAARLVTFDYINQGFLCDSTIELRKKAMSKVTPNGKSPGWFVAPADKKLYAYGIEWLPLDPEPGASQISVAFRGQSKDSSAQWRLTLVAVGKENRARYSPEVTAIGSNEARVSIPVQPGEHYVLALAATPTTYRSLTWNQIPDFDYPFQVRGLGAKFDAAPEM